ncbi:MAG: hypothetical protein A2092_15785 [Rhodobacteraceae bacterium GWE1_64_9]|nr:MAG: hypothetical protein A2092_15785 [Rhodobacteraceae bacterium GWE1_64_9]OHC50111.1 MAG: hypothetical protein A2X69_01845 [Rhodobacteraceae bacterium GWF1_65_7]HBD90231.1 hypothetical protein [Gemmobacter sp.]HBU15210.1 hypothetical protein [Gemmobacter sp.]
MTHKEAILTKATTGVATGGITMPVWWPTLSDTSNWAAQMVPIVSLIWIVLQIVFVVRRRMRGEK